MRLIRSDTATPGIRRLRKGRGFHYLNPDGTPVSDPEVLDRVRQLAIPPAWRRVWISPDERGHIQAVGRDDAGRRQYIYHEQWRRSRDEEKYDRVVRLAARLPEVRAQIDADLGRAGLGCVRVLAAGIRMLDRGVFRVGGEEYAEEHGTRGAATLLREHVSVRRGELFFRYPAKGGIERSLRLRDPRLAAVVGALRRARTGSDRLLVYRTQDGWREVRAEDINARFKELAGAEYSAKDLRTWNATVLAAVAFAGHDTPSSKRGLARVEREVVSEVADQLGNTPAVARRSYVDPRVLRAFAAGRTIRRTLARAGEEGLAGEESRTLIERAVVRLLSRPTG
ncbi:DNA topoisomerase IB [Goodfellowiella coeruleoviolacea]|uniref:DNA topoisomerase n=1 Tax=Goodfellowiella coeruleoviolacea TaxID=334858 RepID=A0AAE3GHY1_9PSEU|nr:DNA topoisomerase IB [Goodfellowiella coeruleoviolacea]MCP2166468.1 DNA topoisomerase IB [Goodfellowiella coeruleoviolacea]